MDRLHGLRLGTGADGTLLDKPLEPLTIGTGKARMLRRLLAGRETGGAHAIAAFGNDFINDGPMLEAVAAARLPGGRPLAALVNQRLPASGAGPLREITFAPRFSS